MSAPGPESSVCMKTCMVSERKPLRLEDQDLFSAFLRLCPHDLSAYHFANIYIWRALFEIFWHTIDDCLCLFFWDGHGCFMYLPPLGKSVSPEVVRHCWTIMNEYNARPELSRIENVESSLRPWYERLGCRSREKDPDYVCRRQDLALLPGNAFKSKRSSVNQFERTYEYYYGQYASTHYEDCMELCRRWSARCKTKNEDPVSRHMIDDTVRVQAEALRHAGALGLTGRVILVSKAVVGYIFGYALNADTFCVLFEVCDLAYRGVAQTIFRNFARELESYAFINIMDDSGLEHLKRVKQSYRPVQRVRNFVIENA
jgi:hypothetical protein